MKLTARTQYAIQALTYLVRQYGQRGYVQISEIAQVEKIPKKFLEHVLLDLRRAGIVESKKGQHGGYSLTRPPQSISLGQALRAVEGRLTPLPSWLDFGGDHPPVGLARVLLQVRDAVRQIIDNTTLEVLIESPTPLPNVNGFLAFYI